MDWIEKGGFGDRPLDGDATHVPEAAERRLRVPLEGPDPERCEDSNPLWTALCVGAGVALAVTAWFLVLALLHPGSWTAAEVTAPLWGTSLAAGALALGTGVVLSVLDAWDAHRRTRRHGRG